MKKKNIIVTPYLDPSIVEEIYKALGVNIPKKKLDEDEGIDEDINEDF
jgi:hypothetical protein